METEMRSAEVEDGAGFPSMRGKSETIYYAFQRFGPAPPPHLAQIQLDNQLVTVAKADHTSEYTSTPILAPPNTPRTMEYTSVELFHHQDLRALLQAGVFANVPSAEAPTYYSMK